MPDEFIDPIEGETPVEEPEVIPPVEEPPAPVFDVWDESTWTEELMPDGFDPDDTGTWRQFGWVPPEQPSTPKQPVQADEIVVLRQRIQELEDVVAAQAGVMLSALKADVLK